jgi:hypothetical protein
MKSTRSAGTTSQVASTTSSHQIKSVTFGSTRAPSTRNKSTIANIPVSTNLAAANPDGDDEEDDEEDEEQHRQYGDEEEEDDDGDDDEVNDHGPATSELVGFGQPLDSYGDRRVPTSDLRFMPGNASYTAPGTASYTADQTMSPSFVGSTTQTAMAYPLLSRESYSILLVFPSNLLPRSIPRWLPSGHSQ